MSDLLSKKVLLCNVNSVSKEFAVEKILRLASSHSSAYVVFANTHVVVSASQHKGYFDVVNSADVVLPDGAPVAWMIRRLGYTSQQRISGPDLMVELCAHCQTNGISIYLYGSTQDNLRNLASFLSTNFPNLTIAGLESPPYRELTELEFSQTASNINKSGAGVVFVGLGCPKQEFWMFKQKNSVQSVMLGVGAAFDFYSGATKRAPLWMRNHGLEWLFRLCSEPRRLWKRYFETNTLFIIMACKQLICRQFQP